MKSSKLIHGVGINDSIENVTACINGSWVRSPIYKAWANMLLRCYSDKYQNRNPSYADCYVCDEWHRFSNFREWAIKQDWEGKQLDKDIVKRGNKVYSPDTCAMVFASTNLFVVNGGHKGGDLPLGVSIRVTDKKYRARCRNPFTGKDEYLGVFDNPDDAHKAWRKRKHEIACLIADTESDDRVKRSLISWYLS